MRQLVLRAADDELAARIAIQRILPGLLAVVRRRGAAYDDGLDELVGAAWIGVRTFNPARGSRCVAAALIADADYRAFRSRWRRRCAGERPTGLTPELPHDDPADTPAQLLADLLARAAAAGVPDDDLELDPARRRRGGVDRAARPGAARDAAHGPQPARPGHGSTTPACGGCVKLACRFSMKARMPSCPSGVVTPAAITCDA